MSWFVVIVTPNVFAQSSSLFGSNNDFSLDNLFGGIGDSTKDGENTFNFGSDANLFGSSSSNEDKDQFTNITLNQTSGWNIFTNTKYGFEFEFPSNWEVLKPFSTGLNMEGIPIQVASIRSPPDGGIHDLVTISMLKPSQYLDTDEMVVKTSILSPQEHAKIVTSLLPEHGFKVIRENPVTVAGLPAYRIEYMTYNYEIEIFVVKQNGTLYTIDFGTRPLKAPETIPTFNKMVESFKFINASGNLNNIQSNSSINNSSPVVTNDTQQTNSNQFEDQVSSSNILQQPVAQIQQFNTNNSDSANNNNDSNNDNRDLNNNNDNFEFGFDFDNTNSEMEDSSIPNKSQQKITIELDSAEFITRSSDNQVKISVEYETIDDDLIGYQINGVLTISIPGENSLDSTTYEEGFEIDKSGVIQFANSVKDEEIDTVLAEVYLTNINGENPISNTISTTVSLEEDDNE